MVAALALSGGFAASRIAHQLVCGAGGISSKLGIACQAGMVCEREEAGLLALRRKKRSADGEQQRQRQMKVLSAAAVEGRRGEEGEEAATSEART